MTAPVGWEPAPERRPGVSITAAWSFAFNLARQPRVLAVPAILAVIASLLSFLLFAGRLGQFQSIGPGPSPDAVLTMFRDMLPALLGSLAVSWLLGLLVGALILRSSVDAVRGRQPRAGLDFEAVSLGLRLFLMGLAMALIVTLLFVIMVIAVVIAASAGARSVAGILVIPGLLLVLLVSLRLSLAQFFLASGAGIIESLRLSWRATAGSVLRIIGWGLATAFLSALASLAVALVVGIVAAAAATSPDLDQPVRALSQLLTAMIGVSFGVFSTATFAVLWASIIPPGSLPAPDPGQPTTGPARPEPGWDRLVSVPQDQPWQTDQSGSAPAEPQPPSSEPARSAWDDVVIKPQD